MLCQSSQQARFSMYKTKQQNKQYHFKVDSTVCCYEQACKEIVKKNWCYRGNSNYITCEVFFE